MAKARDFSKPLVTDTFEVSEMREAIVQLRIAKAASDTLLQSLVLNVKDLTVAVALLKQTIDTSRGALWVISSVAALVGAFSGFLGTLFYHKAGQ